VEKLVIADYEATEDLVDKYAKSYWKKAPFVVRDFVFQDLEDVIQSLWVVIIERKQAREIVADSIEGKEGLLTAIIKRGLVDYIRSHTGRWKVEHKSLHKKCTYMFTTNYMDYVVGDKDDVGGNIIDIAFPDTQATARIEDVVVSQDLKSQLDSFLNSRIRPRELMIYDLVYKDGLKQKAVGKLLDLTESRVNQIVTKVKKKIEKDFGGRIRREEKALGIW